MFRRRRLYVSRPELRHFRSRTPCRAFAIGSGPKPALFRGRIRANSRPDGQARGKTRRKSSKKCWKMAPNGAFSRVQSAISPCPEPTALDRNPPICQTLRLWRPAAIEPPPAPGIGGGAPFFTDVGTDRPHVRAMTAGGVGFTHPARSFSPALNMTASFGSDYGRSTCPDGQGNVAGEPVKRRPEPVVKMAQNGTVSGCRCAISPSPVTTRDTALLEMGRAVVTRA